jgi:hypothetical protein
MTCDNSYENTPDKKQHIANDTPRREEGSIICMLGDTKRIKPTSPSAKIYSNDEERRRDNTSKYGERTSRCLGWTERLPQTRPPW